jgi:cytochrome P450
MATQAIDKPIPGIKETPLRGVQKQFAEDRLGLWRRFSREQRDIVKMHFLIFPMVLVNTAEMAQQVLVDQADAFDKPPQFPVVQLAVGEGVFSAFSRNGAHRRQRRMVQPAFQPRRIAAYADTIVGYGQRIAGEWSDGQVVDIGHQMMRITLGVIGKTLFDVDVLGEADEVGRAITTAFEYFGEEIKRPFPVPLWLPTLHNRRIHKVVDRLDRIIYRIINQRRKNAEDKGDLLSILLSARHEDGSPLSDTEVRDEAMTLFLAGHETTAVALTWAWYLLATHPDAYAQLQAEVDSVLQGRRPTLDDLPHLPYALQVFKEALRMYPPADSFARVALRDVEIGGYIIPKDTTVIVSPNALHHRADYFPEPDKFDPQRWTAENEKRIQKGAYLPFGGGPRICIGNHFATMEAHLILATLAQMANFELYQHHVEPEAVFTTRPKHGIRMRVHKRD